MPTANDMITAVKSGDVAQIKQLLTEESALANARSEDGTSAVLFAMYYRKPEIATLILQAGATLDIFEAATTGQLDRVKALVQQHPDQVNAYSHDGFTPLHLAAFFGHINCAKFLLDSGANVNAVSHNGQTVMPLHSAVASNAVEVSRLLIDHGADVNACQQQQYTPLHESAQNGNIEITEMLLAAQAAVNPKKDDGKTPLGVAIEHKHDQVAALLRQHQAVE